MGNEALIKSLKEALVQLEGQTHSAEKDPSDGDFEANDGPSDSESQKMDSSGKGMMSKGGSDDEESKKRMIMVTLKNKGY